MALFKIDPGVIIWTWITFILVLIILGKSTWKTIIRGLNSRADKIQDDLKEAERTKEKAKKSLATYREQIDNAKVEASSIIENARIEANRVREKIISNAREEAEANKNKIMLEVIEQKEEIAKENPYWDFIKIPLISVNFDELKKKNSDTVGWIKVDNTNINYPVVKCSNNDFYLNHGFDEKWNDAGWIFMDYRNKMDNINKNTIQYTMLTFYIKNYRYFIKKVNKYFLD